MSELDSIFNDDWGPDHRSGVVAVVGRPNVGKSTLINGILGQKIAIVSPTPQTTRRQQLGIYTREDVQILFVDTPGIHDPYHKLGEFMVTVARSSLRDADAVLWLVDMAGAPQDEDKHIAKILGGVQTPVVMVLNKADLVKPDNIEHQTRMFEGLTEHVGAHVVSATTGNGVEDMLADVIEMLPHGPRYYPKNQLSEVNLRFIAAEIVREQVLLNTFEEVPHSVAVEVEDFEERRSGEYIIHAVVWVEKASQKGIVIGKRGSMIKQLGTDARQEMQRVFGHDVQLFLHVKVAKDWRSDLRSMRRFGYDIPKDEG
ncbi:MAG: GTPase Era [Chloroflexota bacterium]